MTNDHNSRNCIKGFAALGQSRSTGNKFKVSKDMYEQRVKKGSFLGTKT